MGKMFLKYRCILGDVESPEVCICGGRMKQCDRGKGSKALDLHQSRINIWALRTEAKSHLYFIATKHTVQLLVNLQYRGYCH